MSFLYSMQTRNELADYLGIPRSTLCYILYVLKTENCYHTFDIPKRSGGIRSICAPNRELKDIQKRLAALLQQHRQEECRRNGITPNISHAFEKKKGIITNAQIHRNKRYVVNIDLVDFFGSIHFGRVVGFFEKNHNFMMSHEVATTLAQLCCYSGKLPQGAPTSPVISNLICEVLDYRVLQIAKKFKLDYTRYADDLTFSTNDKAFLQQYDTFYHAIDGAIRHVGFQINGKKTKLQYCDSRQTVTGLIVNQKVNIDRRYYKETRAMANQLYRTGQFEILGVPGTIAQLEGRFSFINQLDKYDNVHCQEKKRNFGSLNGHEREYRTFLFYKYFYASEKPLIVTEGKTDILYIKAALMHYHAKYPNLVQQKPDGAFDFKVSFFRKSKRLRYFFGISLDGADTMGNIYSYYTDKRKTGKNISYWDFFSERCPTAPQYPVFLLFDNEIKEKAKPIAKFISHLDKDSERIKAEISTNLIAKLIGNANLYLATHQLVNGKQSCEIEDLFVQSTHDTIIDGKKLSLCDKYDPITEYGKDTFSKYIFSNYKHIDFSQFITLLDNINTVVSEYSAAQYCCIV